MFENKCEATETCRNVPGANVWCFGIGDERFGQPTWVQVCGFHSHRVHGWITSFANPHATDLRKARRRAAVSA
jgi:hypothetical protein